MLEKYARVSLLKKDQPHFPDLVVVRQEIYCRDSLLTAWFRADLVKHVLASQCFGNTFRRVLRERVFGICAGDLENTVVEHHHSEQSESHAGSDQNFIHVMNAKASCLFDPVFDERIAQSVLGFRLGKIRAFDDETIFAHFFGLFE
jgi:hypothetical protein